MLSARVSRRVFFRTLVAGIGVAAVFPGLGHYASADSGLRFSAWGQDDLLFTDLIMPFGGLD
jgi:hypothetical protein